MGNLPTLPYATSSYKEQAVTFAGMNLRPMPSDGEVVETSKVSMTEYPFLTASGSYTRSETLTNCTAIFEWDKLIVVDNGDVWYGDEKITSVSTGEKQFAVVNTKLIIHPDMVMVDLQQGTVSNMNDTVVTTSGVYTYFSGSTVSTSGVVTTSTATLDYGYYGSERWTNTCWRYDSVSWDDNTGWTLEGGEEVVASALNYLIPDGYSLLEVGDIVMFKYSSLTGSYVLNSRTLDTLDRWDTITYGSYSENDSRGFYGIVSSITYEERDLPMSITGYYMYITCQVTSAKANIDLGSQFVVGERVTISGCTTSANNQEKILITDIDGDTITFDATFTTKNQTAAITFTKEVPHMDYICEHNNRLWGLSNTAENEIYDGTTEEYTTVTSRVIYASALGLPNNFYDFEGLDTDSYAVAVASNGDFTGIVAYGDILIAMKERCFYKIYGDYPSNYSYNRDEIQGTKAGCHNTIEIISDVLYYVGLDGVYAYSGSSQTLISYNLDDVAFENASGGSDGVHYYVSGVRDGANSTYVYDTRTGVWIREGDELPLQYANMSGQLYSVDGDGLMTWKKDVDPDMEWSATFAKANEGTLLRKRYKWIKGRFTLETDASVDVYYRADGGDWVLGATVDQEGTATFRIPLSPMRADDLQIKMEGNGGFTLESLERTFGVGSDRH